MKTITVLFIGLQLFFNHAFSELETTDIQALEVIENRTEMNGIYYHYKIKNTGTTVIPAGSYEVFLKVNGETVSLDTATSALKPGQTLNYESQKTFYKEDHEFLNYTLEIKMEDSNPANNTLKGRSIL
ncbi:hypothetical protein [Psychroflexus sediminis]|uniref:Uncharacterized protein n=1 Tax=Psychroflexus sediminis TaxID=470826 RepID=A0A1G7UH71_9FLAO|nr:hypothetical protein [Psychroflexus sediminis]SDG46688.1 hypothetical protein SAMN04488027_10267 [Psychroflexus sediminis]